MLYKNSNRKTPDELFILSSNNVPEAALAFQRSVEQSIEQLSNISSSSNHLVNFDENGPINRSSAFRLKWFS